MTMWGEAPLGPEHKRPLYAFVGVAALCAVLLGLTWFAGTPHDVFKPSRPIAAAEGPVPGGSLPDERTDPVSEPEAGAEAEAVEESFVEMLELDLAASTTPAVAVTAAGQGEAQTQPKPESRTGPGRDRGDSRGGQDDSAGGGKGGTVKDGQPAVTSQTPTSQPGKSKPKGKAKGHTKVRTKGHARDHARSDAGAGKGSHMNVKKDKGNRGDKADKARGKRGDKADKAGKARGKGGAKSAGTGRGKR